MVAFDRDQDDYNSALANFYSKMPDKSSIWDLTVQATLYSVHVLFLRVELQNAK